MVPTEHLYQQHGVSLGLHEEKEATHSDSLNPQKKVIQDAWNNLLAKYLEKLCASVPWGDGAILKARGAHTKY